MTNIPTPYQQRLAEKRATPSLSQRIINATNPPTQQTSISASPTEEES